MCNRISDLQTKSLETAQRYVDYQSYGKSKPKAIAALKRRCPGWNSADYEQWFEKAVSAHEGAVAFLNRNSGLAWELYRKNKKEVDFGIMAKELRETHPEFTEQQLSDTLGFAFYLYYLR